MTWTAAPGPWRWCTPSILLNLQPFLEDNWVLIQVDEAMDQHGFHKIWMFSSTHSFRQLLLQDSPATHNHIHTASRVLIGQQQAMINSFVPLETRETVILEREKKYATACLLSSFFFIFLPLVTVPHSWGLESRVWLSSNNMSIWFSKREPLRSAKVHRSTATVNGCLYDEKRKSQVGELLIFH